MTKLRISPDLSLPLDAVTQSFVVLGKRGVGKTSFGVVLAEELLAAKQQVVVADPVGVWWGLRTSADGKSSGLPIYVFGGESRARDLPLELGAGELIADVVVDQHLSVVLDLSHFRKGEQVTFMTAFAERLYHRNRDALHLILDEADAFAPQKPFRGQERMLGAVEDLVRRGRARGIGPTLISQRSAVLNKDVTTQAEILIAFRTIAPQDRAAVEAWVEVHGDRERRTQVLETLHTLPTGTAWFWSPAWLEKLERVRVRPRHTYDSSATPKAGERRVAPKAIAEVDLEQLRLRMAATIERAKAEDPRALRADLAAARRRITELEKQPPKETRLEVELKRVEVPVLKGGALKALRRISDQWRSASEAMLKSEIVARERADALRSAADELANAVAPVALALDRITSAPTGAASVAKGSPSDAAPVRAGTVPVETGGPSPARTAVSAREGRRARPAEAVPARTTEGLPPTQQRILDAAAVLEHRGAGVSIVAIAAVAGVHPNGGRFRAAVKALQAQGFLDGAYRPTESGRAAAIVDDRVTPAQARILEVIRELEETGIEASPKTIATWLDVSPNGGRYRGELKHLQATGLLDGYRLTPAAMAHVSSFPAKGIAAARKRLDPSTSRLLELVQQTPSGLTVTKAAEQLNVHPNGGRFRSAIARLVDMGLVVSRSDLSLTEAVRGRG